MNTPGVLRAARPQDLGAIRRLLLDIRLPVDDLDDPAIDFIVATEGNDCIGVVAVQAYGSTGLLRSLAVATAYRGQRLGSRLVDAAEAHARKRGLQQLVLLTETADAFFRRRGYQAIAREAAPAAVRQSREFRALCPASAICMQRSMQEAMA